MSRDSTRKPMLRRLLRIGAVCVALFLVGVVVTGLIVRSALLRSLPRETGTVAVSGIDAPVVVRRDARGIPVIQGQSLSDVCFGQGFVHAQDRFFQMDLYRRLPAGEVAALMGAAALPLDEQRRPYRFRRVAGEMLAALPPDHKAMLDAYAAGVNAGLADLKARPPEYLALRVRPQPWLPEDALLVSFMMFDGLSFNTNYERAVGVMNEVLAQELLEFLVPDVTRFDSLLIGGSDRVAPVPSQQIVDVRQIARPKVDLVTAPYDSPPGSNNWAVTGSRTSDGRAILENDPHLTLSIPGIWHRAQLQWGDRIAAGVTIPGVPGITIGTTEHVAWGFTNSTVDQEDLVVVEHDPDDSSNYLTPDGKEPFENVVETIKVRGTKDHQFEYQWTRWGPVVASDHLDRPLAMRWTALEPSMNNLGLFDLLQCDTLESAVEAAAGWYGPSQNCLLADSTGRIAWVVTGYIPRRNGFSGQYPTSWARGDTGWNGQETARPMILDPDDDLLYTANNRTAETGLSRRLGRAWMMGTRANRIRERLEQQPSHDEESLLAIALDTRAVLYDWYRDLVLETVAPDDPELAKIRANIAGWNGDAEPGESGYPLLRAFRRELHERVLAPLLAPCALVDEQFRCNWPLAEEPVRAIVEARPEHLLCADFEDWDALVRESIEAAAAYIEQAFPDGGVDVTWGEINRAAIQHPFGRAVPALGRLLDLPDDPFPGDSSVVRVARPSFAASLRMVVSPSHLEDAILHMPAGQSGHFMSRHYADGHDAWLQGRADPLLSGTSVAEFRLEPVR